MDIETRTNYLLLTRPQNYHFTLTCQILHKKTDNYHYILRRGSHKLAIVTRQYNDIPKCERTFGDNIPFIKTKTDVSIV